MGKFFKGWKRKIGVVTLLLACVLTGGWIRSELRMDRLDACGKHSTYGIGSYAGRLEFHRWDTNHGNSFPMWRSVSLSRVHGFRFDAQGNREHSDPMETYDVHWRWDLSDFHIGAGISTEIPGLRCEQCIVPYWSIVIPLTLLSGWLLLSRPRPNQPGPPLDAKVS